MMDDMPTIRVLRLLLVLAATDHGCRAMAGVVTGAAADLARSGRSPMLTHRAIELAVRLCGRGSEEDPAPSMPIAASCARIFMGEVPGGLPGSTEALSGLAALCSWAVGAQAVVNTNGDFGAGGCNALCQFLHDAARLSEEHFEGDMLKPASLQIDEEALLACIAVLGRLLDWWGQAKTVSQWIEYDLLGRQRLHALLQALSSTPARTKRQIRLIEDIRSLILMLDFEAGEGCGRIDATWPVDQPKAFEWTYLPEHRWARREHPQEFHGTVLQDEPTHCEAQENHDQMWQDEDYGEDMAWQSEEYGWNMQDHQEQSDAATDDQAYASQDEDVSQTLLLVLEAMGDQALGAAWDVDHVVRDPMRLKHFLQCNPEVHAQLVAILARSQGMLA